MNCYLVGGAVRDRLLGLPVKDRDWVVVGATPEEMTAAGFRPVGADFPVFLHPETKEEYALARTERKTAPGYRGFAFHASPEVTLEEDLTRRDLTINAMAEDASGTLIDPFGGAADLREGRLQHVSPAFAEDPVRILRVARFAARFSPWGFRVTHATNTLMKDMVAAGEVDALVAERVWAETARALAEAHPAVFFKVLRRCGALRRIFPEIDALFGVPQPEQHHPEIDTGVHVMMVLDAAAKLTPDARVRFAALTHDLGKGTTPANVLPRHFGHEARSVELLDSLCTRLRVPGEYRDLARLVARYHTHAHRMNELRPETALELLEALDAFRRTERVQQFALACEADARGREDFQETPYPQAALLQRYGAAARAVSVADLRAQGFEGQGLGERIRKARIEAIRQVKSGP